MKNEDDIHGGIIKTSIDTSQTSVRRIAIIKVPFGLGGARGGAELGPDELITAGLKREIASLGLVLSKEVRVDCPSEAAAPTERNRVKHLNEVRQVSEKVCSEVSCAVEEGAFPLVLGEIIV